MFLLIWDVFYTTKIVLEFKRFSYRFIHLQTERGLWMEMRHFVLGAQIGRDTIFLLNELDCFILPLNRFFFERTLFSVEI